MKRRPDIEKMRPLERKALLEEIAAMVAAGELQLGDAARTLRSALGMSREQFARAVKLSPRVIAKLEDDPAANITLETLTRLFAPFGGRIGLLFPNLEDPPSLSGERRELRETILQMLLQSRRRPRGPRGA